MLQNRYGYDSVNKKVFKVTKEEVLEFASYKLKNDKEVAMTAVQ